MKSWSESFRFFFEHFNGRTHDVKSPAEVQDSRRQSRSAGLKEKSFEDY